jgi:MSHA biogenesis protein MshO
MRSPPLAARGFTLIELVVVIVVGAIVAVFMVFFLDTPVSAYMSQSSRADLVDSADRILRIFPGDVRAALPSSIRKTGGGANPLALEMLATSAVARYYGKGEHGMQQFSELWLGAPDTDFDTVDQFVPYAPMNGCPSPRCYMAIEQKGAPSAAYAFGGQMTPLPPTFTITANAVTVEDHVNFPPPGYAFSMPGSPTNSAFLVTGPVTYLCDTNPASPNANTLKRYTNYQIATLQSAVATDAQLMAAGAQRSLIAHNVSNCTINIVPPPAVPNFDQLVILEVTLMTNNGVTLNNGETLQVFQEAAVEYTP